MLSALLGFFWACAAIGAFAGENAAPGELKELVSAYRGVGATLSTSRFSRYDVRPEDLPQMTLVFVSGENEDVEWVGRLGERVFLRRGHMLELLLRHGGSWTLERRVPFPLRPYAPILFMRDGRFLLFYEHCYRKDPDCKAAIHALKIASGKATYLVEGDPRYVDDVFKSWRVGYPEPAITAPGHREIMKLLYEHPWLAQNYPGGKIHELAWRNPASCRDSRLPTLMADRGGAIYPATDFVLSRMFGRKRWHGPTAWDMLYSEDCSSALAIFSGYPLGQQVQYDKVQRYVVELRLP